MFTRINLSLAITNFTPEQSTANETMSTVDSLPYYDRDLDIVPNLRQRVEREIEQETNAQQSSTTPSHPFLDQFPPLVSDQTKQIYHKHLRTSLPSLSKSSSTASNGLDLDRLNIPYPDDPTDLRAWEQAFENAKTQLEQQRLRLLNLNLMTQYGSNHWKLSNFLIEKEIKKLESVLEQAINQIDNVNRRRKSDQTDVGDQLSDLSQKWQNLISTNISVEIMNLNLTIEINNLKAEEQQLKEKLEKSS